MARVVASEAEWKATETTRSDSSSSTTMTTPATTLVAAPSAPSAPSVAPQVHTSPRAFVITNDRSAGATRSDGASQSVSVAIESSRESSRPAKGKGGGGKGGSGGGSSGGSGGKGGRGGSGGSGGGEDRRRRGNYSPTRRLAANDVAAFGTHPINGTSQTAAWQSHAVEVSRAGFMPRGGPWSESMCVKRLRIKSRPGLTAFEAGSVAYIEMTLNAVAANEGSVPASPSAAGHLSPPPPPAPARATVSAAPGSLAAVTGEGIERAEATLTYLSSYEGMGIAQLGCTRGCLCDTHVVDAHRGEEETTQRRVSVYKTLTFQLHLDSQRRCVLRLEVLPATRSDGGHKFKVSELALVVRLPRHPRGNATSPSEVSGLKGGGLCLRGRYAA